MCFVVFLRKPIGGLTNHNASQPQSLCCCWNSSGTQLTVDRIKPIPLILNTPHMVSNMCTGSWFGT